jgi:precorrin-2 dehydrogenase/sirohydrochlorin ferrochelatase
MVYPVFLNIRGKSCVVVGGGVVAERKVKGLLTEKADVKVISPEVTADIAEFAVKGRCTWLRKSYTAADLTGAFLVFAATDSLKIQKRVVEDADSLGIPVNVVDSPELCTFHVPATVRRGDLTLAVSTSGKSPAVAAMVRRRLENQYGPEYEQLLRLMGELRQPVLAAGNSSAERKILFQKILHNDILHWIETGQWDRVRSHLRTVLGQEYISTSANRD